MNQVLQIKTNEEEKYDEVLAVLLYEHKSLGWVFKPYILQKSVKKDFFEPKEYAYDETASDIVIDDFTEIVKIIARYDEANILKIFSKKKQSIKEFFAKLDNDLFSKHIRPFIEDRMVECVEILRKKTVPLYIQRDRANLYPEDKVIFPLANAGVIFHFNKHSEGLDYKLSVNIDGNDTSLLGREYILLSNDPCRIIIDACLYCFEEIDGKKLVPFFNKEEIKIPARIEEQYFKTFVFNAVKHFEVKASGFMINELSEAPEVQLSLENNLSMEPRFMLKFNYNGKQFASGVKLQHVTELVNNNGVYSYNKINRNAEFERKLTDDLLHNGLSFDKEKLLWTSAKQEYSRFDDYFGWIEANKSLIEKHSIKIDNSGNALSTVKSELHFQINSKKDWFDVEALVRFGEFEIPFKKIRSQILKGEQLFKLPNGECAIIPTEWFAEYGNMMTLLKDSKDGLKLSKLHFNALNNVNIENCANVEEIQALQSYHDFEVEQPAEINAELRSYQMQGYRWLMYLRENKFGGCLADDMGLGKTLQTLCLLNEAAKDDSICVDVPDEKPEPMQQLSLFDEPVTESRIGTCPSLVVLPSSLVHNWYNEIVKFAPHLRVLQHVGNTRTKSSDDFWNFDIVLTTYGLVRNDIDMLENFTFNYIILDESQVIKNPQSKIYKSVLKLESVHKLVLTGTPIENNLTDLWAQINFVNHGLLGNMNFFTEHFVKEIELGNEVVAEQLRQLIQPFVLRREKSQVAKDLPDLTEQVVYCSMTDDQKSFYEEEKSRIRNFIYDSIEVSGIKKSSVHVLQALTKLRQIANHPKLIDNNVETSGKFDEVCRTIDNIVSENHKVLVFSSFVKHLDLVAEYLDTNNIGYCTLTGSTSNREEVVNEFQHGEDKNVFLISIKAGGVGLNLTSADYVLILDPWWNPAIENQAVSRAHRIGQQNKVFVYRFISEETIEEKIRKLQEQKSKLANAFIQTEKVEINNEMVQYFFD